jgi:hypothetical protein
MRVKKDSKQDKSHIQELIDYILAKGIGKRRIKKYIYTLLAHSSWILDMRVGI